MRVFNEGNSLYCGASQDENESSFEFVCLFHDAAIDSGSLDAEFVEPANRQKIAVLIIKLPIVYGSFGRHVFVNVSRQRAQYFSFDQPWLRRDKRHIVLPRSRDDFLFEGMIRGFSSLSCYSKNE